MKRSSGILMHISSLPSKYGIGTIGKSAYEYADFLKLAGQKYWQILPVGPTSYGDSPYQSFSSFAGNPYFIDPDMLIEDGLLRQDEVDSFYWGDDVTQVDYATLYQNRYQMLSMAKERGWERDRDSVAAFMEEKKWLDAYARFMAGKTGDHELHVYIQFLFYRQWKKFKSYVNDLGIKLIGDIPIYVALDSVDVKTEPEQFLLDENGDPKEVGGVPPDYFSETGQLWGNPLYDYRHMEQDGFDWWKRRIAGVSELYDVIRIDHFRGFDEYWAIPYGEDTAVNGHWEKGPGMALVGELIRSFPDIDFIAEDLGVQSQGLKQLLEDSGFPGMKVLEFGFEEGSGSPYLPHNYTDCKCICYTGTHDNKTLKQWLHDSAPEVREYACGYCIDPSERSDITVTDDLKEDAFVRGAIRCGMQSSADIFIAPMQDWLGFGEEGHMNTPQTLGGNWMWRMKAGKASDELAAEIRQMTEAAGRT